MNALQIFQVLHECTYLFTLYSVRMRKNTDQNNLKYGHFTRSVFFLITALVNEITLINKITSIIDIVYITHITLINQINHISDITCNVIDAATEITHISENIFLSPLTLPA